MTRFVVFNGPPGAGKSTCARHMVTLLRNRELKTESDSFATPIKHFIATLLGEKYDRIKKDTPYPELRGETPRSVLISLSEDFMKVHYGEDVFGRMLYHRSLRFAPTPDFVVVDDSGFLPEFEALGERNNRVLIRLTRPNHDFSHDSRDFLDQPDFLITNDGSLSDLFGSVAGLAYTLYMIHKGELYLNDH
jgi:energy-coupling factor transporter ATP-binding protein EcfA2